MPEHIRPQERTTRETTKSFWIGFPMRQRAVAILRVAVGRRDLNVPVAERRQSHGRRVEATFTVDSAEVKYL